MHPRGGRALVRPHSSWEEDRFPSFERRRVLGGSPGRPRKGGCPFVRSLVAATRCVCRDPVEPIHKMRIGTVQGGRARRTGDPAFPPPCLCNPYSSARSRHPPYPGAPRSRRYRRHGDLHPRRHQGPAESPCPMPSSWPEKIGGCSEEKKLTATSAFSAPTCLTNSPGRHTFIDVSFPMLPLFAAFLRAEGTPRGPICLSASPREP